MEKEFNVADFFPLYPDISEENMEMQLYQKQELYNVQDPLIKQPGAPLRHQKIFARLMSSNTLYNEMLVFHAMGTGKSCTVITSIEQLKQEGGYKGAVIITGRSLINNFKNELVNKCTAGQYKSEYNDQLSPDKRMNESKKLYKSFYSFNSFVKFSKTEIANKTDTYIKNRFSNMIIVLDEVHKIRQKDKEINVYRLFHRFLHTVENCKILLLSGTPMRDHIYEIGSIMNLILPLDNQMPKNKKTFTKAFMKKTRSDENDSEKDIYTVTETGKKELCSYFKGRVSYLKEESSEVKKRFLGEKMGDLVKFDVVPSYMSDFQSKIYLKAFHSETEKTKSKKSSLYSKAIQASLFVFPDRTFGKKGMFNSSENKRKLKTLLAPFGSSHEDILRNIEKYSSKYSSSIRKILEAKTLGKNVFVYGSLVHGGGIRLFAFLLSLFGYDKVTNPRSVSTFQKNRYAIFDTKVEQKDLDIIDAFNNPSNMHGDQIQVIIGSDVVMEGYSFFNIQLEIILTPDWNYSRTSQAIARGYRYGSQRALLESGIVPILDVDQEVAIPIPINNKSESLNSIDLKMYEISEAKDISIKGIERIVKECAVDCFLHYKRNFRSQELNGERDCEYGDCFYTCNGIIPEDIQFQDLDYKNYVNLYDQEERKVISDNLKKYFLTNYQIDLNKLKSLYPNTRLFTLLHVLSNIILTQEIIKDKFGLSYFLQEDNNKFYLSSINVNNYNSLFYIENPIIQNSPDLDQVISNQNIELIRKLCKITDYDIFTKTVSKLDKPLQEILIENSLVSLRLNLPASAMREHILRKYEDFIIIEDEGFITSTFLENPIRTLNTNTLEWADKTDSRDVIIERATSKGLDVYGTTNSNLGTFCIVDIKPDVCTKGGEKINKSKRPSGVVCGGKSKLINIITKKIKEPFPSDPDVIRNLFLEKPLSRQKKEKLQKLLENPDKNQTELWKLTTSDILCIFLKSWFKRNNLLLEDKNCGTNLKKKVDEGEMKIKPVCKKPRKSRVSKKK